MTAPAAKPEWAQSKHDKANAARIAAGEKPRRRRWPWILLALVVLAIIAFVAFNMLQPAPEAPVETAAAETVMQVATSEVTTVAPQTLAQQVKVTGSLG